MTRLGTRTALAALAVALSLAPSGLAAGGRYAFVGGSAGEREQVRAALEISSFNWSLVRQLITIHIRPGLDSGAIPGHLFLDADLLDTGPFAWGVVQHEYAHEVDFFLLDDAIRAQLAAALGGSAWWQTEAAQTHGELASERFASSLAWAYWPSPANVMRPDSVQDEAGALAPAAFRGLLADLGISGPASARRDPRSG